MPLMRLSDEQGLRRLIHQTQGLLLVNFWAQWSDSCRHMHRVMQRLLPELTPADRIVCVDYRYRSTVYAAFNVVGVPTLLVFMDGLPVARFSGVKSDAELRRLVGRLSNERHFLRMDPSQSH